MRCAFKHLLLGMLFVPRSHEEFEVITDIGQDIPRIIELDCVY
jgi:hypothetical protein